MQILTTWEVSPFQFRSFVLCCAFSIGHIAISLQGQATDGGVCSLCSLNGHKSQGKMTTMTCFGQVRPSWPLHYCSPVERTKKQSNELHACFAWIKAAVIDDSCFLWVQGNLSLFTFALCMMALNCFIWRIGLLRALPDRALLPVFP